MLAQIVYQRHRHNRRKCSVGRLQHDLELGRFRRGFRQIDVVDALQRAVHEQLEPGFAIDQIIGDGLTEDAVEGWTAARKAVFDAQLRLISGVFADLSDILDLADRERFMTEVGRKLRDQ